MCGFFSVISPNKIDNNKFIRALNKIKNRGPDSTKIINIDRLTLGFHRLTIIDNSPESMQPIQYGNITLAFNGELYNYLELKRELEILGFKFFTKGDAEVFAAGLSFWGARLAFEKFRGMWACFAYNHLTKTYVVSRDRFGIKPLWYGFNKNTFIFSSEIKSITEYDDFYKKLDRDAALNFLRQGRLLEGKSFYSNVRMVPPGAYAEFSATENFRYIRYWDYKESKSHHSLRSEWFEVMRQHMQSDVPVGLALSGGLDSSLICATSLNRNLATYSLSHPVADNENDLINATVKELNLNHKYVECESVENIGTLDTLVSACDAPFRASQVIYQYAIRRAASKDGVRVLLTGDGADELFSGYKDCIPFAVADLLKSRPNDVPVFINRLQDFHGANVRDLIAKAQKIASGEFTDKDILHVPIHNCNDVFLDIDTNCGNGERLESISSLREYADFRLFVTPTPYWLHVEDALSMLVSIETRIPFLDHILYDISKEYSVDSLYALNTNKSVIRSDFSKNIPNHILNSKKKYQRPGDSVRLVYDVLNKELLSSFEIIDKCRILNTSKARQLFLLDMQSRNVKNADFWFRVLTYLRWMNTVGN